jgi:hypothetical protein
MTRQRKRRRADAARLFASVLFQSVLCAFSVGKSREKKTSSGRDALFFLFQRAREPFKKHSEREREREGTVAVVLYAVHVHFVLVVSGVVERREKTDIRFGKQRGFHHASADCFRYDDYDDDERDDGTTNASGR